MLQQLLAPLIIISALLGVFAFIAIGSLIEKYIVNKTIKFKPWKLRFYSWINRIAKYW
jgi:hypothetical protein